MRRFVKLLFFLTIAFALSCDDVLEENISKDNITTFAPLDGAAIEGNVVQFRWNAIEGADSYRLQILKEIEQIIVFDSLVVEPIFNHQIDAGNYSWRVRGENFAYATPYTFESKFSVEASLDLTDQVITLQSPEDNIFSNDTNISFTWQEIRTAEVYEFNLLKIVESNQVSIFQDTNVVNSTITVSTGTITNDAEYVWQVKAKNQNSETKIFSRKFFIDNQAPPVPSLITPTLNQTFTTGQEVSFTWGFTDKGDIISPIMETIEIASDENFVTLILSESNINGEYLNTFETTGTYYWRVKGTDEAGNKGPYSSVSNIVVN